MPTRFVYVSPEHHGQGDAFDILTPKQFDDLLSEGFAVTKQSRKTVPSPTTPRKKVQVDYYQLDTEAMSRGVAVRPRDSGDDQEPPPSRAVARQQPQELSLADNGSYLGNGTAFAHLIGRTGPQVGSSIAPDVAFGMGVDAAKLGLTKGDCPFPEGSGIARREWMRGFYAGGGEGTSAVAEPPAALAEAYKHGAAAAKMPDDVEVVCPFANGTRLYQEWLRGFEENGGTVE